MPEEVPQQAPITVHELSVVSPDLVESTLKAPACHSRRQARARWATGLNLTPTEYDRLAAFQRLALHIDEAKCLLEESDTKALRRLEKPTQKRPFPLNQAQVNTMQNMLLDELGELNVDPRLKKATRRILTAIKKSHGVQEQTKANKRKEEAENLIRLWETQ